MLIITQFVISLLLLSSSGLPTRGPTSGTGSDGGRTGNSTRDNCDIELNSKQIETLVSTIQEALNGLFRILQRVQLWNSARATVGVYEIADHNILRENSTTTHSDYGRSIAESVSYLQMFVRPVGDLLTNETVREVFGSETGFATVFSTVRAYLVVVTIGIHRLVKGSWDINECIVPNLLQPNDSFTVLNAEPPFNISDASYRDLVVDGVANELQELTADILIALTNYFNDGGES